MARVSIRPRFIQLMVLLCMFLTVVYLATFMTDIKVSELVISEQHLPQPRAVDNQTKHEIEWGLLKAMSRGVVVKMNNHHPSLTSTEVTEEETVRIVVPRPISLGLRKENYHPRPPQNKFQWLYNDTTTLLYSAHYDNRDSVIKIVGFKHRFHISKYEQLVLCQYPDKSIVPMTTLYNVSVITPRPGLEYNSWIWVCSWQGSAPPTHLTLTTQSQQVLLPRINITHHTFPDGAEKIKQPLICVKPMVNNYSDAYQLREFIEMSRLSGTSKIVLYPYSINETVIRPILEQYRREGLVDTHEWLPPVPVKTLHAYGQKSHNQHCLYTYMYRYQWAAFIDLDEMIVTSSKLPNLEFMIQAGLRSIKDASTLSSVGR